MQLAPLENAPPAPALGEGCNGPAPDFARVAPLVFKPTAITVIAADEAAEAESEARVGEVAKEAAAAPAALEQELEQEARTSEFRLRTMQWDVWKHVYTELDQDQNGSLSVEEFQKLANSCGDNLTHEQAADIVARYDKSGNGVMEFDEFEHYLFCSKVFVLPEERASEQ